LFSFQISFDSEFVLIPNFSNYLMKEEEKEGERRTEKRKGETGRGREREEEGERGEIEREKEGIERGVSDGKGEIRT
jgi:hypothetical protein